MADYQTCFCPECRGCLRSRRTVFRHRNLYGLDRYTENIKCSGQPSKKAKFSNLRTSEIPGKSFLLLIALCRFKYICMPRKSSTGKTYWEKLIWDWTWGIWNSKSRICNQGIWTIRQNKSKKVNLIGKSKWIWLNYNGIFNFTWWCISIFFCILFLQDAAGQPAGHDNPPSIDIKSGSCEVNVTNDAHTLIGESHQEVLLLQEMILDFSRK